MTYEPRKATADSGEADCASVASALGSGGKGRSPGREKPNEFGHQACDVSPSDSCGTTRNGVSCPDGLTSEETLVAEAMVFHQFGHQAPEHIEDVAIEPVPNITVPNITAPAATTSHWRKLKKRLTKVFEA